MFVNRTEIPVSRTQAIQLRGAQLAPLEQFIASVNHQRNYLKWLQKRHDKIIDLKEALTQAETGLSPKRKGAKGETYRKYLWSAECMGLLDVINSFEFFYKASCIGLAIALGDIIPASQIKGKVEARFIWQSPGYSTQRLLFEHRLFHDVSQVNEVTKMLIGETCYNAQPNNTTYRCIQAVFQIRHTLSHNSGQMTQSDATKLQILGFNAAPDGALDPGDDNLEEAIFRFLVEEAKEFTGWLEKKIVNYINTRFSEAVEIPVRKSQLLNLFTGSVSFDAMKLAPEPANADN
jgi:hypothetical protein